MTIIKTFIVVFFIDLSNNKSCYTKHNHLFSNKYKISKKNNNCLKNK